MLERLKPAHREEVERYRKNMMTLWETARDRGWTQEEFPDFWIWRDSAEEVLARSADRELFEVALACTLEAPGLDLKAGPNDFCRLSSEDDLSAFDQEPVHRWPFALLATDIYANATGLTRNSEDGEIYLSAFITDIFYSPKRPPYNSCLFYLSLARFSELPLFILKLLEAGNGDSLYGSIGEAHPNTEQSDEIPDLEEFYPEN